MIAIAATVFTALVGLFAVFYEGIHSQTRDVLAKVGEHDKRVNKTMKDFNQEMTKTWRSKSTRSWSEAPMVKLMGEGIKSIPIEEIPADMDQLVGLLAVYLKGRAGGS